MGSRKPKVKTKTQDKLPVTDIKNKSRKITFSYKYLDLSNSKYSMDNISDFRKAIQFYGEYHKKLKEYSGRENWNDQQIRESCFTCLNKDLMEQVKDDCWQLGINSTTFRIHGFFVGDTFYIVWLDPLHQLYPSK